MFIVADLVSLIYDFVAQLQSSILFRVVYFQSNNSRNDLFIATIQICNELVFLCLQNYLREFQTFVKQLGSLISNFNIKQEDSWVLGR